jgi:hypothetical protein
LIRDLVDQGFIQIGFLGYSNLIGAIGIKQLFSSKEKAIISV